MNTKTPPAWAIEAAREIEKKQDEKKRYSSKFVTPDWVFDEQAEIITRHAPDAEALAVALEEILTAHDSDAASGGEMWYAEVLSPIVSKQRAALAAYRSAHPKPD